MREWLRRKLRKWLGIDDMYSKIDNRLKIINESIKSLSEWDTELAQRVSDLRVLCNSLPKLTDAGLDIGLDPKCHVNWAVFVSKGNGQDYVKFVDLSDMTPKDVKELISSLERTQRHKSMDRYRIDAPIGIKFNLYEDTRRGR